MYFSFHMRSSSCWPVFLSGCSQAPPLAYVAWQVNPRGKKIPEHKALYPALEAHLCECMTTIEGDLNECISISNLDFSNLDFGSVGEKHLGRKAKIEFSGTKVQINLVCGCKWEPLCSYSCIHESICVCECVLHLTGTSSDWCSRLQGGLMGRGLVASQYASTAVRAPMPTSVEVGRERKNWPRSSISGILRPLIISWACIFSIRVELSSAGQRRHFDL